MTPEQEALVGRLRRLLGEERSVREVSMFGGVAVMVEDRLVASASKQGGLLVRVDPERDAEMLVRPGARRGEKGRGRAMSAGWIEVEPASVAEPEELAFWVTAALQHHRATGEPGTRR